MRKNRYPNTWIEKLAEARKNLRNYSGEQVCFVEDGQTEITKLYSNYGIDDRQDILIEEKAIQMRREMKRQAVESGLLTEEGFNDLYQTIDIINTELALPYC